MNDKRATNTGVRIIVDPANGAEIAVAVGPVARNEWMVQVLRDHNLRPVDLKIAVALQSYVNTKDGFAFPKHLTLAADTGVTTRTIQLRLPVLIERGHVHQRRRGPQSSNYFLVLKEPNDASVHDDKEPNDASVHGSDRHSDISDRTESTFAKNRIPVREEPNFRVPPYKEGTLRPNSATELGAVAAARLRAPAAPARATIEIRESPAREPSNDPSPSPAGSLTRLEARSPAGEDSERREPLILAGYESLHAGHDPDDEWIDDDGALSPRQPRPPRAPNGAGSYVGGSDDDGADLERQIAKERREEERDAQIANARRDPSPSDGPQDDCES